MTTTPKKKLSPKAIALIIFVDFIMLLAVVIFLQPDTFNVSRTAIINAKPEAVFTQVNNLHNWHNWSPWAKLDPNAIESFDGPAEGVGAIMHWDGNNDVGKGTMTVVESQPNSAVKFRLDFEKPMEGTNDAAFTLTPNDNGTTVTWTMSGKKNFIAKAIGLVMDCDKMIGGMFEQGLDNLKAITEPKL